ncbi:hypothetical protein H0E87_027283 [Populus deltoides]|uniref:NUC153 domain-containing protein n=1 Tax=Populus deltoides TaxID=3696 RepID=A0A8T2X066_POPDE|nr:hypothetical protein H0E87_027283 [Populus deltoides]
MATKGSGLKSTSINGVKIYMVSSQQRNPASWVGSKKQRPSRKDKNYQQKIELVQDLTFPTATSRIKVTPDGEFLIASGIHPPQIKVYELREFALKFERHFDSEIIDFQILDDDYSKLAFLCADRSVCLHAKYGKHYTLRIPRMGRDMAYDCWSCDLLCAASSSDLYRINLEKGQFLSPLRTQSPGLNVVCRSKLHGLVACGGDDGAVECFDMRTKSSIGRINAVEHGGDINEEVTALKFDEDGGFTMAVGSSGGKVLLYDLRSSHPMRVKDHMYGSAILDIKWHRTLNSERQKLITTDKHVVRIWDPETGDGMTSIEPTAGTINDICVFSKSGLMFLALDCSQIPSYFIPSLGPAPKWLPSIENLTEEMEEDAQTTIYDNFKFLTKEDLEKLNLTSLIGTNLLRASMHGFFIDYKLYKKAKQYTEPFEYETYREQQTQKKLEEQFVSRITIPKKLPKVNRKLAASVIEKEAEIEQIEADKNETKKASRKKKGLGPEIFEDERFKALFEDKDFEIDENSTEYLALHPMASMKQPSLVAEHFELLTEDEDQSLSDSDNSAASQSSGDEHSNGNRKLKKKPRLYEVKDERHAEAFWNRESLADEDSLPLGERAAALGDNLLTSARNNIKFGPGGSREISFTTRSSATYKEDGEDKDMQREKRRGIQSLGLKSARSGFRGNVAVEILEGAYCLVGDLANYECNHESELPAFVQRNYSRECSLEISMLIFVSSLLYREKKLHGRMCLLFSSLEFQLGKDEENTDSNQCRGDIARNGC